MKARIKSLEEVSEGLRGEYTQNGEFFDLTVEAYTEGGVEFGLSDTSKIKGVMQKERTLASDAKKAQKAAEDQLAAYSQFSDLGAEGIQGLVDFKATSGKDNQAALDTLKAQYDQKLQEKVDLHAADVKRFNGISHESAIGVALGNATDQMVEGELAREVFGTYIRNNSVVDNDGSVKVVDANGMPRMSTVVGSTEAMSVGELLGLGLADPKYDSMVKGSGNAGSGSVGASGGGGGVTLEQFTAMDNATKLNLHNTNKAQYDTLAAEELAAL